MKRRLLYTLFIFLFGTVIFFNLFCGNEEKKITQDGIYLNHNDTVKYVGMDVCKACHYDKYKTFIETGMGESFGAATRKKSAAKFDKHQVIYDKYRNFYYKPYFEKDNFYIMEYRLEGKDTIHKRIEKVDYIIGSGQHTNSHLYEENGYFFQMPLTFYTQEGRWDLPPGFEKGANSRFSRAIELECMSCHNAYPNFVEGSKNKYASILQGIDCERCHGPGSLHVREKTLGHLIDTSKYIDYTIVNPKKLSYELQVDLCQRCHLQGNAVLKEGKSFFDFRPGQKLSDYMDIFLPRYSGNDEAFIMASHADRLKQSKCFIQSKNLSNQIEHKTYLNSKIDNTNSSSLTCISCHNPHVSVKVTGDNQFNDACKKCHGNKNISSLSTCTESPKIRNLNNDNCWKCHMPQTGTIDIPHVTVHDHKIQKPISKKQSDAVKKFIGIAAINNPNPDNHTKGEAYLSYFEKFDPQPGYLDSAAYYLSLKGNFSKEHYFNNLIRLYFLKQNFKQVASIASTKPTTFSKDSWTLYRIGEAYFSLNNVPKSYDYYKIAVEKAPYNLEFRTKLGGAEVSLGKMSAAKATFEFVVKENPKFAPALSNLGYIYLTENRVNEAETLYNKAIASDPDYEQAFLNKVGLYLYLNKKTEAITLLKQILKKNPTNKKARDILNSLHS